MAKVPGFARASVHVDKIDKYLLVPRTDDKSKFMFGHGFGQADTSQVADALLAHIAAHDVSGTRPVPDWNDPSGNTIAGHNYAVSCAFQTPDGRNPCIKTVWTVLNGQRPTFQTLIPKP
jgi:hypothetical protein